MPSKAGAAAVDRAHKTRGPERASDARLRSLAGHADEGVPSDLDRLIHERMRLGIVSSLAVNPSLTFNELKALLKTTDGNLCIHARKLEEAAYITCNKSFDAPAPGQLPASRTKTRYKLTPAGRRALERYLDHMEALIRATRER
jgi:DNA-binding MarR family transcriptional regulator